MGDVVAPLAHLTNASNGSLVTILACGSPGASVSLVGLFYLGCVPAAIAEVALPKVAGLPLTWAALWITLVAVF